MDKMAYLFLVLPSMLLGLRSKIRDGCLPAWQGQLYQACLLYLYTGLALRKNILRVNGSDIRPCWIRYHYSAMTMALISLTWEIKRGSDCGQKQNILEINSILDYLQSTCFPFLAGFIGEQGQSKNQETYRQWTCNR